MYIRIVCICARVRLCDYYVSLYICCDVCTYVETLNEKKKST